MVRIGANWQESCPAKREYFDNPPQVYVPNGAVTLWEAKQQAGFELFPDTWTGRELCFATEAAALHESMVSNLDNRWDLPFPEACSNLEVDANGAYLNQKKKAQPEPQPIKATVLKGPFTGNCHPWSEIAEVKAAEAARTRRKALQEECYRIFLGGHVKAFMHSDTTGQRCLFPAKRWDTPGGKKALASRNPGYWMSEGVGHALFVDDGVLAREICSSGSLRLRSASDEQPPTRGRPKGIVTHNYDDDVVMRVRQRQEQGDDRAAAEIIREVLSAPDIKLLGEAETAVERIRRKLKKVAKT